MDQMPVFRVKIAGNGAATNGLMVLMDRATVATRQQATCEP